MRQILDAIQSSLKIGEYVKFGAAYGKGLGEIVNDDPNTAMLRLFKEMNSELLQRYHVRPLNNEDEVLEVY